jgi:Flp pilus assembly protein TadB
MRPKSRSETRISDSQRGKLRRFMILLLLLLAALVVLGIVLAVVVIKWLFILAVVAALIWLIAFFTRGISRRV